MFLLIPQLLIIASLVGIVVIVSRRVPELERFFTKTYLKQTSLKLWDLLGLGAQKLWHFVLEVKGLRRPSFMHLPRSFGRIHLPRPTLRIFGSPDSAEFYLAAAEKSFERGELGVAEEQYIKAIKKEPANERAFAGLGKIYLAQEKFAEAIETYKFLVKHHPQNDSYYASLGQAYHSEKLYDLAVDTYEQAIALEPQNPKRYINLGLTLEAQKHLEEAILNYRRAVDLDPDNTQFMMVLADALMKKGEKEEAEHFLEKILQLEPTNHLAREKLMQLKF